MNLIQKCSGHATVGIGIEWMGRHQRPTTNIPKSKSNPKAMILRLGY